MGAQWAQSAMLLLLLLLAAARAAPRRHVEHAVTPAVPVSFQGHKVLRVVPGLEQQVMELQQFLQDHPTIDAWLEPSVAGRPSDLRVNVTEAATLGEFLGRHNLTAKEMIPDLGRMIEDEQRGMLDAKRESSDFGWETYHTLEEINKWMRELELRFPNDVSLVDAGRTYEGRLIMGVMIRASGENAPAVLVEGGIHAREWISPATSTFLINEILTSDDEDFKSTARAHEWHIFPVANPDGYVYTHTTNRMWRKTRSRFNHICQGADPNRNWPFHWREAGASASPCSDVYAGIRAESEPETRGLKGYLDSLMKRANPIRVYISLHSYSQLLMYPWSYTFDLPKTNDDLSAIATAAALAAKKRHGTVFKVGPIARTIYRAAGSTIDYAYYKGVKYPFVFELRDDGTYGFLLPKEQIRQAAEETVDAIATITSEAAKRSKLQ